MVFNPWDLLLLLGLFIFFGVFFLVFVGLLLWLLIRNQNVIVSPGVIFISVGGGPPLTESYVLVTSGITIGGSAGTGLFHRHAAKTR